MKQKVVIITAIIAFVAGVFGAVLGRGHFSFISADVTSIANDLGQERSKNITLNYELETVTNRLNQSTSQLREKSSQLLKTQGQIATLSDRAETAESRVRILESSDLNQLSAQLVEAQGQIKQLTARAEKAESRVKTLEPKQPTGPSLKDRWKTVQNSAYEESRIEEAEKRMGQPPTLVIHGMWCFYPKRHEWDQSDWESKIFPRYKVDRTTWPKELIEVRPEIWQKFGTEGTVGFRGTGPIVLLIWVLDDDSIGALCATGDGRYPDELARTLPRSALPNAK